MQSRREFLQAMTSASATGLSWPAFAETNRETLKDRAAAKGLMYGCAVEKLQQLMGDPGYTKTLVEQCEILVPGNDAKFARTEPEPDKFDFGAADTFAQFCRTNGLRLRLHNLVWQTFNPPWLVDALEAGDGRAVLERHIENVAGHFRGQADSWDVVNEAVNPQYAAPDGLARGVWYKALGENYIPEAFRLAHRADPASKMFLNDDDLEYEGQDGDQKRATYLRVIERWLREGVPIQGFGFEAHLKPTQRIAETALHAFLTELAGMGLTIYVTELDVSNIGLPSEIRARDQAVAAFCKQYLDIVLDVAATKAVITWGLSNKYSWLNNKPGPERPDKLPSRGLPYDDQWQPTPMWNAIADAFANARMR